MEQNLVLVIRRKVDTGLDWLGVTLRFDAKYLVKGIIYLFSANTLGMVMGILLSVTLARVMGEWGYAQYGLVISIIGTLSIFALPGMNTAITRAVARGYDQVYTRGIALQARYALLGALACVPAGLYFSHLKNNPSLGKSFYAAGVLFIPLTVLASYNSFLYGRRMFKVASRFYALTVSFSTCATILTLIFTRYFYHIMLAYLLSTALCNAFFFWRTLRQARNGNMDDSSLSYGKHLTLIQALSIISGYIDSLFIAYFLSLPDLAMYMVAMAVPPQIKTLFKSMSVVLFPKMSLIEEREVRPWVLSRVPLLLAASLLMGGVCALIVPFAIPLLYSAQYAKAVPYAQILIIGVCLGSPSVILLELLKSQQRTRELYLYNIIVPLLNVTLWAAAILWKGLAGLVVARAMSWPLASLIAAWFLVFGSPAGEKGDASPV
jgi:O-antigen/teichoic acid export membrane protein